jgi:hypothetical protein
MNAMQSPKPGAREDGLKKEDGPEKLLRWSGSLDHVALNHALLRILRRVWKVRAASCSLASSSSVPYTS